MRTDLTAVGHTLFAQGMATACVGSFVLLLLTVVENEGSSLGWNAIEFLLFRNEVNLWLGLHLIATICKELLLLLLCQLTCLYLLHRLLTELESWVLSHCNKAESLVRISTWHVGCTQHVMLHIRVIRLHCSIRLSSASVLSLTLTPRLLVMGTSNIVLLNNSYIGVRRPCSIVWLPSILEFQWLC